jgi:hypothetical protein
MLLHKDENFANAREVRNIFEAVYKKLANRIASESKVSKRKLLEITSDDIEIKNAEEHYTVLPELTGAEPDAITIETEKHTVDLLKERLVNKLNFYEDEDDPNCLQHDMDELNGKACLVFYHSEDDPYLIGFRRYGNKMRSELREELSAILEDDAFTEYFDWIYDWGSEWIVKQYTGENLAENDIVKYLFEHIQLLEKNVEKHYAEKNAVQLKERLINELGFYENEDDTNCLQHDMDELNGKACLVFYHSEDEPYLIGFLRLGGLMPKKLREELSAMLDGDAFTEYFERADQGSEWMFRHFTGEDWAVNDIEDYLFEHIQLLIKNVEEHYDQY